MPTDSPEPPRTLPQRPNLRHLRDQAKDLLKAGKAESLTDAQLKIAQLYGFVSWPKLKAHVDALEEIGQLKRAIDRNDIARVKVLMTRNPELHRAPMGYGNNGPLTWVAECRVPWQPPGAVRLAIAEWMIDNGSDIHQGGDGPLMRAALNRDRVAMMELLVSRGANVNASWNGDFPILFAPCEAVNPVSLKWLLDHGADPNRPGRAETALDYLLGTYARSTELAECIGMLIGAGGTRGMMFRLCLISCVGAWISWRNGWSAIRRRGAAISGARFWEHWRPPFVAGRRDSAARRRGVRQCGGRGAAARPRRTGECSGGGGCGWGRRADGDLPCGDAVPRLRIGGNAAAVGTWGGLVGPRQAAG